MGERLRLVVMPLYLEIPGCAGFRRKMPIGHGPLAGPSPTTSLDHFADLSQVPDERDVLFHASVGVVDVADLCTGHRETSTPLRRGVRA
jgi:hypothetical protein